MQGGAWRARYSDAELWVMIVLRCDDDISGSRLRGPRWAVDDDPLYVDNLNISSNHIPHHVLAAAQRSRCLSRYRPPSIDLCVLAGLSLKPIDRSSSHTLTLVIWSCRPLRPPTSSRRRLTSRFTSIPTTISGWLLQNPVWSPSRKETHSRPEKLQSPSRAQAYVGQSNGGNHSPAMLTFATDLISTSGAQAASGP